MEEEKKGAGFVIKDKRVSAESGEQDVRLDEKKQQSKETPLPEAEHDMEYPPVNFTNFVLSLSTSAFFHFGDFPESEGGKTQKNLPAAKQTIDILDMMNEKSKGNLNDNEKNLIEGVLYELKLRYVKEKG